MTPHDELAEDERIIAGATAGPWVSYNTGTKYKDKPIWHVGIETGSVPQHSPVASWAWKEEDAAFIARSRTRWPALVAEVRELREALKELLAGTFEGTSDNLIRMEKARVLLARHEEA